MKKEYLGDGLYIEVEYFALKVTSENGIEVLNTIVMESREFKALQSYYNRAIEEGVIL